MTELYLEIRRFQTLETTLLLSALGCSVKPGNSSRSRTGTLMEAETQIKAKKPGEK